MQISGPVAVQQQVKEDEEFDDQTCVDNTIEVILVRNIGIKQKLKF